jgi:hypothetical protein
MLLRLHIHRCTADVHSCREVYEGLLMINDEALRLRKVVVAKNDPPLSFVKKYVSRRKQCRLKGESTTVPCAHP